MYIDWTYIVLVLPAMLFAMWASSRVNSTFKKYKNTRNSRGLTGAQAADDTKAASLENAKLKGFL